MFFALPQCADAAGNDTDDTLRPFPQHSVGMCQLLPSISDL